MINTIRLAIDYPSNSPSDSLYIDMTKQRFIVSLVNSLGLCFVDFFNNRNRAYDLFDQPIQEKDWAKEKKFFVKDIKCHIKNFKFETSAKYFNRIEGFIRKLLKEVTIKNYPQPYHRVRDIGIEVLTVFMHKKNVQLVLPCFKVTTLDLQVLPLFSINTAYINNLFCYHHALYEIHEEELFKFVFPHHYPQEGVFTLSDRIQNDTTELFKELNYLFVDKPERGDLVLYFETKEEQKCLHMAVAVGGNEVVSKWGGSAVFKHIVEDVPFSYGNCVKFARKPFKFKCQSLFIKILDGIARQLNDTDSLCGRMNFSEVRKHTTIIFKVFSDNNIRKSLPRGLYGREAIQLYAKNTLEKIEAIEAESIDDFIYQARTLAML